MSKERLGRLALGSRQLQLVQAQLTTKGEKGVHKAREILKSLVG